MLRYDAPSYRLNELDSVAQSLTRASFARYQAAWSDCASSLEAVRVLLADDVTAAEQLAAQLRAHHEALPSTSDEDRAWIDQLQRLPWLSSGTLTQWRMPLPRQTRGRTPRRQAAASQTGPNQTPPARQTADARRLKMPSTPWRLVRSHLRPQASMRSCSKPDADRRH